MIASPASPEAAHPENELRSDVVFQEAAIGSFVPAGSPDAPTQADLRARLGDLTRPLFAHDLEGMAIFSSKGSARWGTPGEDGDSPLHAYAPACPPERLGDGEFLREHGVKYPYIGGSMANGIASVELVEALARGGMLAFFGAAGLEIDAVEKAIDELQERLGDGHPFGFNLIHSPADARLEADVVSLYLRRGIHLIEASAYIDLTLPVVRYRLHGIHRGADGAIRTPNRIIAKVSRIEVATKFMSPPPERFIAELVEAGELTAEQAELARCVPMAQDITVEADSGGHTDNRPALAVLPTMIALGDRLTGEHGYAGKLRMGAAGGIATPIAAAAAFAAGAAYIVTGTVNQACVESGSCEKVRQLLAEAEQADTAMAPAADMFEIGARVQVLKRGTLFPMRASKLHELYRSHDRFDAIPAKDRETVEKKILRAPFAEVWKRCVEFFLARDPVQVQRGEADEKHRMALVFRWYLGMASKWANSGEPTRTIDYQIWCGPAMGAFNEWVKDSTLADPAAREVRLVARNILYGAALQSRLVILRQQGVRLPADLVRIRPLEPDDLEPHFGSTLQQSTTDESPVASPAGGERGN